MAEGPREGVNFGDRAPSSNPGLQMTWIDDSTWTVALAVIDTSAGIPNASVVAGVMANGIQVRKATFQGLDLGDFGSMRVEKIFV
jgi:hypothetical protein